MLNVNVNHNYCMSHLLGDVQAESVHDVSEEEEVDLALAVPVVDVADVLNLSLINLKGKEGLIFIHRALGKRG